MSRPSGVKAIAGGSIWRRIRRAGKREKTTLGVFSPI